jgi:surface antigen
MRKLLMLLLTLLLVDHVALGCATKSQTGALTGAGVGAATGAALGGGAGGILLGGVLGAALGFGVGKVLEEQDRRQAAEALEDTPDHRTANWRNPDTGLEYHLTPHDDFYSDSHERCRSFEMLVEDFDGEPKRVEGTACRGTDGTWRTV